MTPHFGNLKNALQVCNIIIFLICEAIGIFSTKDNMQHLFQSFVFEQFLCILRFSMALELTKLFVVVALSAFFVNAHPHYGSWGGPRPYRGPTGYGPFGPYGPYGPGFSGYLPYRPGNGNNMENLWENLFSKLFKIKVSLCRSK